MEKVTLLLMVAALVTVAQAEVIPICNGDFEMVEPMTDLEVIGFDNGVIQDGLGTIADIPCWHDLGGTPADSGTEKGGYNPTGTRNMFLMYDDFGVYQTTEHTIAAGERYQVDFLVGDIWEWAYLTVSLYYDDPANVFDSKTIYADAGSTGWLTTMTTTAMQFDATVASEGHLLGIIFQNSGGTEEGATVDGYTGAVNSWLAVDNVALMTVPETNCFVDFEDFALFAAHWLESSCDAGNNWCSGADIDNLGDVNVGDLETLAFYWLSECPAGWGL